MSDKGTWIAIVDMDQCPDSRHVLTIQSDDNIIATYDDLDQIKMLHEVHSLGVFDWWAFDVNTGEAVLL